MYTGHMSKSLGNKIIFEATREREREKNVKVKKISQDII